MEATGERFIPGSASWLTHDDHFSRYLACRGLCAGRVVLDAACGSGYGSNALASVAEQVYGIDVDPAAVDYATQNYGRSNTSFRNASVTEIPFEDASIDVVVSFETLEHIPADAQLAFMGEIKRVLRPNGTLVMSTPDRLITDERGTENEFHVHELTEAEFSDLLESKFDHIELYHQNMWAYNEILPADSSRSIALDTTSFMQPRGQNMIAVCSDDGVLPSIAGVRRSDHGVWELQAALAECAQHVSSSYEGTISWRVTAPLRWVRRLLK